MNPISRATSGSKPKENDNTLFNKETKSPATDSLFLRPKLLRPKATFCTFAMSVPSEKEVGVKWSKKEKKIMKLCNTIKEGNDQKGKGYTIIVKRLN